MMSQGTWVKPDFGSTESNRNSNNVPRPQKRSDTRDKLNICVYGKEDLLLHSCQPKSVADLVVQKKKIDEVRHWLSEAYSASRTGAPFLLLTGPPGCGKLETVRLLCRELGIDVHMWEEQIRYEGAAEWAYKHGNPVQNQDNFFEEKITDVNPLNHLRDFMNKISRYQTLKIKTGNASTSMQNKRLLVIKDLPAMVYANLDDWHGILTEYWQKGKTPCMFIQTHSAQNHSSYGTVMKLFPSKLQEKLSMSTIQFNALATSFILKVFQKVINTTNCQLPENIQLEEIAECCNGDLRSGLNTLQLILTGSGVPKRASSAKITRKRKITVDAKAKSSVLAVSGRDGLLDFMHALGKVLYSKRNPAASDESPALPPHLVEETRAPLKERENLDIIVDHIGESSPKVLLYLHQNFPPFFNRIEDIARATHHLSTADLFSQSFPYNESLDKCALLVGVRGIMHSNTEVVGSSWRPLVKPEYLATLQKQREIQMESQALWPLQNCTQFFTEELPYMRRLLCHHTLDLSPAQVRFVQSTRLSRGPSSAPVRASSRSLADCQQATPLIPSRVSQYDDDVVVEEFID